MTELFAHGVYVTADEDVDAAIAGIINIHGKDWEGQPFRLVLNSEEANSLLVQLGFQLT